MRKSKTKKTKLVAVLLILVLLISVGYAALTTNLSINGTATVKAQNWNVHFTNIVVDTANNSVASVDTAPTLSNNDTTVTWEVSMDTPGQVYKYNVDVTNEGTIDAMVNTATNSIVTNTLTQAQQAYLDYTITYVNGAAVEQYDKLAAGETKTLTVRLAFKQDIDPEDLPETAQNGISLSYTANYVQADNNAVEKVTEIASLEIGDSVAYTTTLNGQTLNNWKVFYVDGDYTYIILDDYLPRVAISDTLKTNYNLANGDGDTYTIISTTNRTDLINAMTTTSNWAELINNGEMNGTALSSAVKSDANVIAKGAPDLELWVNSWNASYPADTLYTKYENPVTGKTFDGYFVGDSANPTTKYISLSSKTGYNNTLYYPHQSAIDNNNCYGHWLASPSADYAYDVVAVVCSGIVNHYDCDEDYCAIRPVVCLPSSIINQ